MSKKESRSYEFGPYRLLPAERQLLRGGEPVTLTPKAFETLVALVERGGRLVEKEELLNVVWAGTTVEESNVAQNVFALRRALGHSEDGGQYIETVPKRGYRFLPKVSVVEDGGGGGQPAHQLVASITSDAEDDAAAAVTPRQGTLAPSPSATAPVEAARPVAATTTRSRRAGLIFASVILSPTLVGLGIVISRLFLDTPAPASAIKMSRLMSGGKIWSAAVSPDGRHVAHVVEHGGQTSIWVRQVSTTTDLHVIPPERGATYWGLSFSRDGDLLYYVKHSRDESFPNLFRVPAFGGPSRKIVADVHSHVTTSPDGKQIAFVRESAGESLLMIADADGANERRLAVRQKPAASFSSTPRGGPSWSPDGRTIATGIISLDGGYHGELIAVSVADGTERPLTSRRWYQVAQVAWLADGMGLLAAAREASGGTQIWHVSYPQGEARKVTSGLNDYHGDSLTADSRTLATVQRDRPSTIAFVPEKPPSASQRATAGMNEGFYGLSWTPDGRLVYASDASGNHDIWLMEQDGVVATQLTTDPHNDSTSSVSPDGRSVVFLSFREGDTPHVWRMDIDGGNQRRLTNHHLEGTPSFTPDGRWIVYAVAESGIWKVPAEGGDPVLVFGGNAHTPSVSPDGTLVACFYREDKPGASGKIALLPSAGGPPAKLFDEPEGLSSPTLRWTGDARSLVYVATRGNVSNLWTLPLDGKPARPLTDFTSDLIFNFAWSRDNKQLALARGNTTEHVVLISDFR